MTDKIKLLALANRKVANDNNFVAFFLVKYSAIEKLSDQDILCSLGCNLEEYYKLGLCRTPDVNADNFLQCLNNICNYSHVSASELNKIIKRVNSVLKFSAVNEQGGNSYLMAARDKKKNNLENK